MAMNFDTEIQHSIHYLSSSEGLKAFEADVYWPKWNSPWWHMLLLHEMGETKRIPAITVEKFIDKFNQYPLKIFAIHPGEMPEGVDPYRESPCSCQLGNVYQVLAAYGVDVDQKIPWIRPWLLRYQMGDGGMSCDSEAYLVKDETPSSMVGTIAAFEAILLYTPRAYTPEEKKFLDQAARFLMKRKLTQGSDTRHNAIEREESAEWLQLCFPRFYFYDVLRGLNALFLWAEKNGQTLPRESYQKVITDLSKKFPDGQIYSERISFEGEGTLLQNSSGEWLRKQPATFFPLLEKVSAIGEVSPFLSRHWAEVQTLL